MNTYSKTVKWWNSKAPKDRQWESLSEEEKIQAAWDASLALRADIIDIPALEWVHAQMEILSNATGNEAQKRLMNIYLDRLEKMRLACIAFK